MHNPGLDLVPLTALRSLSTSSQAGDVHSATVFRLACQQLPCVECSLAGEEKLPICIPAGLVLI